MVYMSLAPGGQRSVSITCTSLHCPGDHPGLVLFTCPHLGISVPKSPNTAYFIRRTGKVVIEQEYILTLYENILRDFNINDTTVSARFSITG